MIRLIESENRSAMSPAIGHRKLCLYKDISDINKLVLVIPVDEVLVRCVVHI